MNQKISQWCVALASLTCLSGNAQDLHPNDAPVAMNEARLRLQAMSIPASPPALVQHAAQGDVAVVNLLLKAGVPITAQEPLRNVTALHNAAAQGHVKLTRQLLDGGADVNAQDINGATPLINAVYGGYLQVAKLLLSHKADPAVVPRASPSALNLAVQRGDMAMFDLLLKSSAPISQADVYGQTPLMQARLLRRTAMIERLQSIK